LSKVPNASSPLALDVSDASLSDARLGRHLWELWVRGIAEARGVDPLVIADQLRAACAAWDIDATDPGRIAEAMALRHAARGKYAQAGRTIRKRLVDGAARISLDRLALYGAAQRAARRKGALKAALRATSDANPDKNADRDTQIRKGRVKLIADGHPPSGVAQILASKHGLTPTRIRQILGRKEKRKRH
jgi:hypothetical protein